MIIKPVGRNSVTSLPAYALLMYPHRRRGRPKIPIYFYGAPSVRSLPGTALGAWQRGNKTWPDDNPLWCIWGLFSIWGRYSVVLRCGRRAWKSERLAGQARGNAHGSEESRAVG